MTPLEKIKELLNSKKIEYKISEHEPTPTSEDAARIRGVPLESGAKALVVKAGEKFLICVLSASKRLSIDKLCTLLKVKKIRFASKEELIQLTGLVPGSIPPIGQIFNLPTLVDHSIKEQEIINFNAGSLTTSITMKSKDYLPFFHNMTYDISE